MKWNTRRLDELKLNERKWGIKSSEIHKYVNQSKIIHLIF